jgi:hypothetical protein
MLLTRGRRARRLLPLTPQAAKSTNVDLVPGFVAVGATLLSTGPARCQTAPPVPAPDFEIGPTYLTPAGVLWWVEENVVEFGGAETVLKSASIGSDCSVSLRGAPVSLNDYNDDTSFPGFSVDRGTLYFGDVALPLSELD